jgi:hypothetical protein
MGSAVRLWERAYQGGFGLGETHATIAHLTEFLIPHVYALGSRQRRMQITIRASEAGATALRAWYRAMKGPGLTGLVIPDDSENDAWWVRQAVDYAETVLYPSVRDVSMTLVEHATGVPL